MAPGIGYLSFIHNRRGAFANHCFIPLKRMNKKPDVSNSIFLIGLNAERVQCRGFRPGIHFRFDRGNPQLR